MPEIKTDFTAKNKQFLNSIKEMNKSVNGFGKSTIAIGKTAAKGFAIVGVAAVAIGAAFFAAVNKALEFADSIGKVSDTLGVSTDFLQKFRFAMDLAGNSSEATDKALLTLSKNIGELKNGTGALTTFLLKYDKTLIQTFKDTNNVEDATLLLLNVLEKESDATQRLALARAAAGRGANALVVAVKDTTEAFRDNMNMAEKVGAVMREKFIRSAEEAKDQMSILAAVINTQLSEAFIALTPQLNRFIEFFINNKSLISGFVDEIVRWTNSLELLSTEALTSDLVKLNEQIKQQNSLLENSSFFRDLFDIDPDTIDVGKKLNELLERRQTILKIIADREKSDEEREQKIAALKEKRAKDALARTAKLLFLEEEKRQKAVDGSADELASLTRLTDARRISVQAFEQQLLVENALTIAKQNDIEVGSEQYKQLLLNIKARDKLTKVINGLDNAQKKLNKSNEKAAEQATTRVKNVANMQEELKAVQKLVNARMESEEAYKAELLAQEAAQKVKSAGIKLSDVEYAQAKRIAEALIKAKNNIDAIGEAATKMKDPIREALAEMKVGIEDVSDFWTDRFQGMEDALVDFVKTGKLDFKSLMNDMTEALIRFYIQSALFGNSGGGLGGGIFGGGLLNSIGSIFSEQGNVFSNGNVTKFAKGGVMDKPFSFPLNNGIGIGSENAPESIMPLQRDARGNLGVTASGITSGGNTTNIFIDGTMISMTGASNSEIGEAVAVLIRENTVNALSRN